MVTTIMPAETIPTPDIHTPSSLDGGRPPLSHQETLDAARQVEQTLQAWGEPTDHLQPVVEPEPAQPMPDDTPQFGPRPKLMPNWEQLDGQMVAYGEPYGSEEPAKRLVRFEREGDTLEWDANRYTNHDERLIEMWVKDDQSDAYNTVLIRGNNVYTFKPETADQAASQERITLFDTHDLPPATIGQPYSIEALLNGQLLPESAGDKVLAVDVALGGTINRDEISNANHARKNTILHDEKDLFAGIVAVADKVDEQLEQAGILALPGQVASVTVLDKESGKLEVVNKSAEKTQTGPVDPPTQPMPTRSNEAPGVDNMSQETKDLLAWKAGRMPKAKRIPGVDPESAANIPNVDGRFEYEPTPIGDVYVVDAIWKQNTPVKWDNFSAARRLNRQILISTEDDKQYVVHGDRIYDLAASQEQGKPVSVELDVDEALPDAVIGQPWKSKLGETDAIARIEILAGMTKQTDTNLAGDGVENPFSIARTLKTQHIEQAGKGQRSKIVQKAEAGAQTAFTRSPAAMKRALAAGARVAKKAGPGIMKASDKFYEGGYKIAKGMHNAKERAAETVRVRNARIGAFVTALIDEMPPKAAFEAELVRQFVSQDIETERELEAESGFVQGVMGAIYLHGMRLRREAEAAKRAWGQRKDGEEDDSANQPW